MKRALLCALVLGGCAFDVEAPVPRKMCPPPQAVIERSEPWPCGVPPLESHGACEPLDPPLFGCDPPYVYQCGAMRVTLTDSTLEVDVGDCHDVHSR